MESSLSPGGLVSQIRSTGSVLSPTNLENAVSQGASRLVSSPSSVAASSLPRITPRSSVVPTLASPRSSVASVASPRTASLVSPRTASLASAVSPRTASLASTVSPRTASLASPRTASLVSPRTASLVSPRTASLVSPRTASLVSPRTASLASVATVASPRATVVSPIVSARTTQVYPGEEIEGIAPSTFSSSKNGLSSARLDSPRPSTFDEVSLLTRSNAATSPRSSIVDEVITSRLASPRSSVLGQDASRLASRSNLATSPHSSVFDQAASRLASRSNLATSPRSSVLDQAASRLASRSNLATSPRSSVLDQAASRSNLATSPRSSVLDQAASRLASRSSAVGSLDEGVIPSSLTSPRSNGMSIRSIKSTPLIDAEATPLLDEEVVIPRTVSPIGTNRVISPRSSMTSDSPISSLIDDIFLLGTQGGSLDRIVPVKFKKAALTRIEGSENYPSVYPSVLDKVPQEHPIIKLLKPIPEGDVILDAYHGRYLGDDGIVYQDVKVEDKSNGRNSSEYEIFNGKKYSVVKVPIPIIGQQMEFDVHQDTGKGKRVGYHIVEMCSGRFLIKRNKGETHGPKKILATVRNGSLEFSRY